MFQLIFFAAFSRDEKRRLPLFNEIRQLINRLDTFDPDHAYATFLDLEDWLCLLKNAIRQAKKAASVFDNVADVFHYLDLACECAEIALCRLPDAQLIEPEEMLSLLKTDALTRGQATSTQDLGLDSVVSAFKIETDNIQDSSESEVIIELYQTYALLVAFNIIISLLKKMQTNYKGNNPYKATCFQAINAAIETAILNIKNTPTLIAPYIYEQIQSITTSVRTQHEVLLGKPGVNLSRDLDLTLALIEQCIWSETYFTKCLTPRPVYTECAITQASISENKEFALLNGNVTYDIDNIIQWLLKPEAVHYIKTTILSFLPESVETFLQIVLDHYKENCKNPYTNELITMEEKIALAMRLMLIKMEKRSEDFIKCIYFSHDQHYRIPTCEKFSTWPLTAPEGEESQQKFIKHLKESFTAKTDKDDMCKMATIFNYINQTCYGTKRYLSAYTIAVLAKELVKIPNPEAQAFSGDSLPLIITELTQLLVLNSFDSICYTKARNLAILSLHAALPLQHRNTYILFVQELLTRSISISREASVFGAGEDYNEANTRVREELNKSKVVLNTAATMYQEVSADNSSIGLQAPNANGSV